jgi:hypothetical protein
MHGTSCLRGARYGCRHKVMRHLLGHLTGIRVHTNKWIFVCFPLFLFVGRKKENRKEVTNEEIKYL